MSDETVTLADLRRRVSQFVAARDWEQYHGPKNLSMSIAIEAAELMEHFQWLSSDQAAQALQEDGAVAAVADELADVLLYSLSLANVLEIDLSAAILGKLERNERRFPVQSWRGRAWD